MITRRLLALCGQIILLSKEESLVDSNRFSSGITLAEGLITDGDLPVRHAALWLWTLLNHYREDDLEKSSPAMLDELLNVITANEHPVHVYIANFALATQLGLARAHWCPHLDDETVSVLVRTLDGPDRTDDKYGPYALCILAFHSQTIWDDDYLAQRLLKLLTGKERVSSNSVSTRMTNEIIAMLDQMGEVGRHQIDIYHADRKRE